MVRQKFLLFFLLLFIFPLTLAGCSNTSKEPIFRYALESEPATLDPAKSTALPESLVELQIFEGLTRLDEKDQPAPGVAESWDVSADGLTYTFHLRPNAKWSNGDPVTANDFIFAWKRVLDPDFASENAYMLFPIKNSQDYNEKKASADELGMKALDSHTLEVTLDKPTAYFLSLVAFHSFYPLHEATVLAEPDRWALNAKTLITNGPFKVMDWRHGSKIEFAKNDQYWDAEAVKMTKMNWPISDSQTTRLSLFENKQVQMMVEPPIVEQERLSQNGVFQVAPTLGVYYYVFNTEQAPFDNPKVRQALSLAINREALVQTVIKGGKQPAYAWVAPGLTNPATGKDFRSESDVRIKEDIQKAKELLAEAGYPNGQGIPPVNILFNTGEMHKAIAEALQEMWQQNLNIPVTLTNQESKVFLASRSHGQFQIARASWVGDYADPMTFMDVFKDPENDAKYKNPEYNGLVEKAQQTDKQNIRFEAMHKAEKLLLDDAVILPIYYTTQPYVARPQIKGYFWSVLGLADFKKAYLEVAP